MLEPPEEYYELVLSDGDDASPALKSELEPDCESQPSVTSAEWPNVEESITEESQTPLLARVFRYPSSRAQQVPLLGKLPTMVLFSCFVFGTQEVQGHLAHFSAGNQTINHFFRFWIPFQCHPVV